MKKVIIILLLLTLTSIAIAGNLKEKSVAVDVEVMDTINSINDKKIVRSEIICDDEYCYQSLDKGEYSLGRIKTKRYICDKWEKDNSNETPGLEECSKYKEKSDTKIKEELSLKIESQLKEEAIKFKKIKDNKLSKKEIPNEDNIINMVLK